MAFDVAEAYNKKRKEEEEKKATSSSTPFDVAERYELYKRYENTDTSSVNDDYINTFMSDVDNFFKGTEETYKGMGWGNASSVYDSTNSTWQGLKTRGDTIYAWLYQNKSRLTEDSYKSLTDSLDSIYGGGASILEGFEGAKNFYGQFETEDSYNQWKGKEGEKKAILGAEDFAEKSQYQSTRNDTEEYTPPWWLTLNGQSLAGSSAYDLYDDVAYEYINKNQHVIDKVNNTGSGNANLDTMMRMIQGGDSPYDAEGIDFLTDEEIGVYNYYYHTQGKERADEFLESLVPTLKYRKAYETYESLDNDFKKYLFGAYAGYASFFQGVANAGNLLGGHEAPISSTQIASGLVRDSFDTWIGGMGYDLINTVSNQVPNIALSLVPGVGQALSLTGMGLSAAGNAYQDAINNKGMTKGQAQNYGVLVGASEAALQYLLGGISSMAKGGGNGVFQTLAGNALNHVDNAFARVAIQLGGNMLDEGLEESLQTLIEPVFEAWVTGEKYNAPDASEVLYSGLLGALSAGMLEGGGTIVGEVNTYKAGKAVQNVGAVDRLTKLGSTFSADTVAYKLAGKVNENTGAYTIGRLLNEVGATLTEQNQSEIIKSLTRKGVLEKDAKVLAKYLEAVVEGNPLTEKQAKILEYNNDVLAKTVQDVIVNQNSTVNQRVQGYAETMGMIKSGDKAIAKTAQIGTVASETGVSSVEDETAEIGGADKVVEGKTTLISTGEEVKVKEISSIRDGEVSVWLEDGREASVKDIDFGNENEGLIYEAVANMNPETARDLIGGFNQGKLGDGSMISLENYLMGFNEAYRYGTKNIPTSELLRNEFSAKLSDVQRRIAYNRGKTDSITKVKSDQASVDAKKEGAKNAQSTKKTVKAYNGETHINDTKTEGMTARQKESVKALKVIADAFGLNIYFFESPVVDGKRVGKNGYYNSSDKSIHLDLYAGQNGRQTILFTAAHELTHLIKDLSPAKFKVFADFLFEQYGKKGVSVEELIQAQIAKAKKNGRDISYETAYEEVVADACETMLADGNAIEKIAKLKAKDKTLWEKIKDFIKKLVDKIKAVYAGLNPDSMEAKYVREMVDVAEQLQALWTDALVDAGEAYSAIGDMSQAEFVSDHLATKDIKFNLRYAESHKSKLAEKYDEKEAVISLNTLNGRYDKILGVWERLGGKLDSKFLNEWNNKLGKDRTFSVFKAQAGYKYNVELSSMCKKGVPLFEAIDTIVKEEVMKELDLKELGKAEKEILYDILKLHHFEIPCAICYVEQARQREGAIINAFLDGKIEKTKTGKITQFKLGWNEVLKSVQEEMRKNGVDYTFPAVDRSIATDKYVAEEYTMDEATQTAFYNALKKIANKEISRYNEAEGKSRKLVKEVTPSAIKSVFSGTLPSNLKIFKVLFQNPSSRFTIASDLLYSSMTTQNLAMAHNDLYGLFNSQGGVSGYKSKQGTIVYWGDILGKKWEASKLRGEGGVRNQSNSDFQMYTLLDQVQMYIDFSAKGYYLQAYTKVLAELKLFGLSNGKINASLIPRVVEYRDANGEVDVAKTMATAGLDEKGNPIYDDIEGINHKEAFMLIEDADYSKSITGICIGYSDAHINKLLDDPRVQLIIGFHDKTDDGSKRYRGARYAKNYNGLNEAYNIAKDETVHIGFNPFVQKAEKMFKYYYKGNEFSDTTIEHNGKTYRVDDIPNLAADLYLEMCEQKGYKPAYDDFKGHPNYYKLLADFGLKDSQGHYAPHKKVAFNMPDSVPYLDINGKKQYMSTESYIEAELEKELAVRDSVADHLADKSENGIIPQFKKAVEEARGNNVKYSDRDSAGNQLTAEQQEFFKDSQVRDKDGNLLVVYNGVKDEYNGEPIDHGFTYKFLSESLMNKDKPNRFGFFFTDSKKTADDYSMTWRSKLQEMQIGRVNEVYLNIKNPLDLRSLGLSSSEKDFFHFLEQNGVITYRSRYKSDYKPVWRRFDVDGESLRRQIEAAGYDGVVFHDYGENDGTYVAFSPEQIKLTANKKPTSNPDIRYSDRDLAPTFYSQMGKVVEGMKQDKFAANSVVSMLRGRGVKAEEIRWSGIVTFLEGKKSVTKAELMEFIQGSQLQIGEEILSNEEMPYSKEEQDLISKYEAERDIVADNLKSEWKRIVGSDIPITYFGAGLEQDVVSRLLAADTDKRGNTEDGYKYKAAKAALQRCIEYSDNYFGYDNERQAFREAVRNPQGFINSNELTSFEKGVFRDFIKAKEAYNKVEGIPMYEQKALIGIAASADRISSRILKVKSEHRAKQAKRMTKWGQYKLGGGTNYREILFKISGSNYYNDAMAAHWDERDGVLAHARIQDFKTASGKKMLFIEEIQSDWHNEGKKKGYADESVADYTLGEYHTQSNGYDIADVYDGNGNEVASVIKLKDSFHVDLRNGNYFGRFKTEKEVLSELKRRDNSDVPDAPFKDTYHEYVLKRLLRMAAEQGYDGIGWTTADIQSKRWSDQYAEGYRIEYDQDIPKFLKKYGRQWGAKVGYDYVRTTTVDASYYDEQIAEVENDIEQYRQQLDGGYNTEEYEAFCQEGISDLQNTLQVLYKQRQGEKIWSMELTDSMKDSVLHEGQVLYSDRDTSRNIGKELIEYKEGNAKPDLTLVKVFNERTGKTETTIKFVGDKPEGYIPKKIAYCYKLFEQHPDGTLHALFAGATNATPIGEWQYAKGFPNTDKGVKGMNLRERYGWHLSAGLPSAPHLMSSKDFGRGYPSKNAFGHPKGSKRVWVRMAYDATTDFNGIADSTTAGDIFGLIPFGGYYAFKENNQSEWVISSAVKIDKILTETERQQILQDAGYDEYEAWRKKHRPTEAEKAESKRRSAENKKAKDLAKKAGLNYLSESAKEMREAINSRIIENPELSGVKYSDRDPDSVSNRSLLANALESAVQNDIERNKLEQYKAKIDLINAEEQKLQRLTEEIKQLFFTKGARNDERIRNLQFERKQTINRINTYDRQLLTLEASKPLKAVLEREKVMAYKRAEQKGKEALSAYREKAAKTQRELMTRYQESRAKATENRHKTELRHKIKDVVSKLNQLLTRPTKDKHIKEELRTAVAEALSVINMDTVGADERVAKYNALIAKTNDPDMIAELTRTRNRIELQGEALKDKLTALQTVYEKVKNSTDPELKNAYQEPVMNAIKNVVAMVGNTSIRDMSLSQLEAVYEMYSMVLHTVRTANKAFKAKKGETITQLSEAVNDEIRKVGKEKFKRNPFVAWLRKVGWTLLKPYTAFRTIGSNTFTGLFTELRNGEDVYYVDINEAKNFIHAQYEKHNFKKWDKKKTYTFTAKSGKTFTLTLEQVMSLYAYSRRNQAHDHIIEGGIVLEDSVIETKNKLGIPVKYNVDTKSAFNISEEVLDEICNSLTAEQKSFVENMQDYLSDVMGAKGNEVSMELLGVKLFKEKFYFPLKSSKYYMGFKPEEAGEIKLKNSSFSKETVQHANNPVVLQSFTDVWANHINDMSMYHAFVLPLEDFTRVYNYKTRTDEYVETMSTEATIANAYGEGATQYIRNFLKSLNGGVRIDGVDIADKMVSLTKKGAVLGSASVTIQQPSAIMRAMALINPIHFVTTAHKSINLIKHKRDWTELKTYAPIAGIKEMGGYDIGIGQGTVDWIKDQSTFKDKVDDALGKAPAFMDEITWVSIWNAVKRETASKNKGMDVNSEEFLKKAGERFTEVITFTQVYDSVFSRSDIMRNANPLAKMLTAFMAEPTTTLNMLVDSFIEGKRTGKVGGFVKATAGTTGAVVAAIVFNAALKSIITAMRDDDEDESYAEKYLGAFVGNTLDELNPLSYIPFVKDIVSIFNGYDVERMDMALFSDLKQAIDAFDSDSKSEYEKWSGLVGAVSAFFGVPVKNVERDIRGAINTIMSFINGEKTTSMGIENAIKETVTGKEISNAQQLYEAMIRGDQGQINRVKARFDDEDEAISAVRSFIRKLYTSGDLDYDTTIRHLVEYGGIDEDDAYWRVQEWDYVIEHGDSEDYSKYNDFFTAVETGKNIKAVIKDYTDNGVSKETLAAQITKHFKPLYKAMTNSQRAGIKGYLLNAYALLGYNRAEKSKDIDNWLKD